MPPLTGPAAQLLSNVGFFVAKHDEQASSIASCLASSASENQPEFHALLVAYKASFDDFRARFTHMHATLLDANNSQQ